MAEKKYFALKLIAPRPTFAFDMNEEERSVMTRHVAYWADLMKRGIVIVFGPVFDPQGPYGLGVIGVDTDEQANEIITNDPAVEINRYEMYPMRAIVPEK